MYRSIRSNVSCLGRNIRNAPSFLCGLRRTLHKLHRLFYALLYTRTNQVHARRRGPKPCFCSNCYSLRHPDSLLHCTSKPPWPLLTTLPPPSRYQRAQRRLQQGEDSVPTAAKSCQDLLQAQTDIMVCHATPIPSKHAQFFKLKSRRPFSPPGSSRRRS